METGKTGSRRRYSLELKARIMAECEAPGASVARVAMAHGINANVVHSWRKRARGDVGAAVQLSSEFVPVAVAALATDAPAETIQIQLRRGASTLTISWPASAAAQLAQWTREVLQ